jgi:hypothetical protein
MWHIVYIYSSYYVAYCLHLFIVLCGCIPFHGIVFPFHGIVLFLVLYSLFMVLYSLFMVLYSLFMVLYSLFMWHIVYIYIIQYHYVDVNNMPHNTMTYLLGIQYPLSSNRFFNITHIEYISLSQLTNTLYIIHTEEKSNQSTQ